MTGTDPTTPAWVDDARNDTPGVNEVVHLNNAGAALPPTQVLDTILLAVLAAGLVRLVTFLERARRARRAAEPVIVSEGGAA